MKKFELIYSILSETASSEDKKDFQNWVSDENNLELFEQIKRIWQESPKVKSYKKHHAVQSFYQMNKKIESRRQLQRRYFITTLSGIAAGLLIMFGLFKFVGTEMLQPETTQLVHMQTDLGNRTLVYLPDGSKVWLNAKSDLKYASNFDASTRDVFLQGEGYFEVEKDTKPFIVHANDFKVKVYGTKFNVSAYNDDRLVQTCLESGKVSLQEKDGKEYFIKPGELALFDKTSTELKIKKVDPREYTGWMENKLYLHNEPIGILAKKLERQYKVTIGFTPSNIGEKIHYTGVFGNESLEEILDAIAVASELRYKKEGTHYQIIQ
ncbi:FecR family protein [Sunxiuqinia sp. A32]|uniref:FecR family protein n=1 Tax=Sunxiuqinia sp. A32 TaxID=3461496 RepID=UPI0040457E85